MQRRRITRRGSLSLSIQAIVILVMAMAILGLGLGFIRTLIGKGQVQLSGAIDNAELENPATSENPITVDQRVVIKQGKTAEMKAGIFNKGDLSDSIALNVVCAGNASGVAESSIGQTVPISEARAYKVVLTAPSSTETGSYPCVVETNDTSKSL
ncbi:MAG: hypothetical protein ABIA93_02995, partial [Candidatus Woesearchaeota archaeon]